MVKRYGNQKRLYKLAIHCWSKESTLTTWYIYKSKYWDWQEVTESDNWLILVGDFCKLILLCNVMFLCVTITIFEPKYKYEYIYLNKFWPIQIWIYLGWYFWANTNTNLNRIPFLRRIRIRIYSGLSKACKYEYKYVYLTNLCKYEYKYKYYIEVCKSLHIFAIL